MDQNYNKKKIKISFLESLRILKPYILSRFMEQFKSIWFIVFYLVFFQWFILDLPIVYAGMIGMGVVVVLFGLMFFMEGLSLGLMPFGEMIGAELPKKSKLPVILSFAFVLGVAATFAEPAIAILKEAGSNLNPSETPLLYSLLNNYKINLFSVIEVSELVLAVGVGVGIAVLMGVLRFLYGWSLKWFIIPLILILLVLTGIAHSNEVLKAIIGLAWDCGAVTTGPVTVPLVLALGMGVCRVVSSKNKDLGGFGIVTLASLVPILMVLLLGGYHFLKNDYYGQPNFKGERVVESQIGVNLSAVETQSDIESSRFPYHTQFTIDEYKNYKKTGDVPDGYKISFRSSQTRLENGRIIVPDTTVILSKKTSSRVDLTSYRIWDASKNLFKISWQAFLGAFQAIVPLCIILYFTVRLILKEKIPHRDEIGIGVLFALVGMSILALGLSIGLVPLGSQLGSNIPSTFSRVEPWGLSGYQGPLYGDGMVGKCVAILFAFLLGYGATLAEPALHALGATVEKLTVGAFKKKLLLQTVAIGVGLGLSLGIVKMIFGLSVGYMLIVPYALLIVMSVISTDQFVNIGWDSAGVTTGPITVPLVLAMGLGIGKSVPNLKHGFGILALASVMPILLVLIVGLLIPKNNQMVKR